MAEALPLASLQFNLVASTTLEIEDQMLNTVTEKKKQIYRICDMAVMYTVDAL